MNLITVIAFCAVFSVHLSVLNGEPSGSDDYMPPPISETTKFLLYDVNPGEGFNLRRDVYVRIVELIKTLREKEDWILVLPPWSRLYHWQSPVHDQIKLPWSMFFDLNSLNRYVPVIEFEHFVKVVGEPTVIDQIYYLQYYKGGFTSGGWVEKFDFTECNEPARYVQDPNGQYRGWFYGYDTVSAANFSCVSYQGVASFAAPLLQDKPFRSVMLPRGESLLHNHFGQYSYWAARRSMRFAKHLRLVGDEFRRKYLNSTDEEDRTVLLDDWREMKRQHGDALGGPYLGVHLRRKDFLYGHKKDVPSLEFAAEQISGLLSAHKLNAVFIATDAADEDFEHLKEHLPGVQVLQFVPTHEQLHTFKDGGVAIIDQWICAHARYFIGTQESTFSFRIHEEREILGFKTEMTLNRLCGDEQRTAEACEQPGRWTIVQ